ncbi:hypothetical protein FB45DRAFT_941618 [Roridomyces roridus]|uniref:Uncharacterized protein n=1 Tax=Roridomyces roridus TaxID=1738132 RepID=A0AAD7B5Z7_9AGAR|nr:hypothetical protein FB45DRAFT_941618 [Roridomyces roridus]
MANFVQPVPQTESTEGIPEFAPQSTDPSAFGAYIKIDVLVKYHSEKLHEWVGEDHAETIERLNNDLNDFNIYPPATNVSPVNADGVRFFDIVPENSIIHRNIVGKLVRRPYGQRRGVLIPWQRRLELLTNREDIEVTVLPVPEEALLDPLLLLYGPQCSPQTPTGIRVGLWLQVAVGSPPPPADRSRSKETYFLLALEPFKWVAFSRSHELSLTTSLVDD